MGFYMPTRVYAEIDCVAHHASEIASYGKNALIVTGRRSAKVCGALDDVTAVLQREGRHFVLFDEVEENPSIKTIMKAAELGIIEEVDFVIGVGGGSPMDAAKAIALMICHPGDGWRYLYDRSADTTALPVLAVPTTCGTGSEVTGVSVLTNPEAGTKVSMVHRIFPEIALVDGRYLRSATKETICNTAMDALCHAVESFLCSKADSYSKMLSLEAMRLWRENKGILDGLGKDGADSQTPVATGEENREEISSFAMRPLKLADSEAMALANASVVAGMAIAQVGTVLPHALSYHLTYAAGIPHGKACGYFLTNYVRGASPQERGEVLLATGFSTLEEMQEFYEKMCGSEVLNQELLRGCVDEVAPNEARMALATYPIDYAELERIAGIK